MEIVAGYDDETAPSVTPRRRMVQRSKPTDVNDDKGGEASTPVQDTATADPGLSQRPKRPAARRVVRRSKPTDVNDGEAGEASTPPQNTAPADSGLENSLLALSMNDAQSTAPTEKGGKIILI